MAHMNGFLQNGHSESVKSCNGTNGFLQIDEVDNGDKYDFLKRIFKLLIEEGLEKGNDLDSKIVEFVHPKELQNRLDLRIQDQGVSDDVLLDMCKDTIKYSVKTGHRRFFNQLYAGINHYGLAGSWLTDTVNTSQYTFEVAPVFTLMEQAVLGHMSKLAGYSDWDGIFCPGGSVSNMYGLNLARYHKFPEVKEEGMYGLPRICLFTSEQSHYSMKKGAALLGIGHKYIITVPCNSIGKMDPIALDNAITKAKNQGLTPFLVNATGGTTVAGAYDPLDDIADVCQRHDVWMHVDCAWGGGALLSRKHKHLLKGLERADSLAWNPHKMMGAPLQCCAFLTKHKNMLQNCHSANARYLFQQDKFYDVSYDTGDKSVQCGRKVDVFKIWLMWKANGDIGFEQDMDNIFENAKYFTEKVKSTDGFRLLFPEPECTNVCFWYIPPCIRGQEETSKWWQLLSKVAPIIKERMVMKGSLLIGYQPLGKYVNSFRMVISNTATKLEDMDFAIDEIQRLGEDITEEDLMQYGAQSNN